MNKEVDRLVAWLQDEVAGAGAQGLIFGLSGGIDSALMAALAKRAFPDKALGVIMPINSNPEDEKDARLLADQIDLWTQKVDLAPAYQAVLDQAGDLDSSLAKSNIKPRLRMSVLYYYGQAHNLLVCGCTNASEFYTGYFTKYGDSACDLFPLVDFTKTEVYDLARFLDLPQKIIDRRPTAGLLEGQDDEKDMGFSYKELDAWIREGVEGPNIDKIKAMHKKSGHKRVFAKAYRREQAKVEE
ncbi:MAG: NAD(+) synthase [Tissierellia bacterium]|nr:NAD(+) synthase [Tissierellia bacterium]